MRTRGASFNRGRWQLERERCRIADPLPPRTLAEAKPIQTAIETALRRLCAQVSERAARAARIEPLWNQIVGPDLRTHCRRGPFENGMLVLYVENTIWLDQIRRFHLRRIEQALRGRLGPAFQRLVLRLDPGDCA